MWWNPIDFHWDFWFQQTGTFSEFTGKHYASNYCAEEFDALLMGGEL